MAKFLSSNETKYRLLRTILQGIIGVLAANIDLVVSGLHFDPEIKAMIVALVMAILSPIMSELGASAKANAEAEQDTFNNDAFLDMIDSEVEHEYKDNTAKE